MKLTVLPLTPVALPMPHQLVMLEVDRVRARFGRPPLANGEAAGKGEVYAAMTLLAADVRKRKAQGKR